MKKLIMLSLVSCLFSCLEQSIEKEYIITYNDGSKDTVMTYNVVVRTAVDNSNLSYYNFEGRDYSAVASIPFNKVKKIMNRHDNIR